MKGQNHIDILRSKIELDIGTKVTIANSSLISKYFYEKTKQHLSATTIQRFFELIKNDSKPSKNTLDVLSQVVGYKSYNDFQLKVKFTAIVENQYKVSYDESSLNLFELCLNNYNIDTVIQYIDNLSEGIDDNYRAKLSNLIGFNLRDNRKLRELLISPLSKSKNGRIIFFETFVDFDNPDNYYSDSISNFYLPNTSPINQKKFKDDWVFGSFILIATFLKMKDRDSALKVIFDLYDKVGADLQQNNFSHHFPYYRYCCIKIIECFMLKKTNCNKTIQLMTNNIILTKKNVSEMDFKFGLNRLIEILYYVGDYTSIEKLFDIFFEFVITPPNNSTTINSWLIIAEKIKYKHHLNNINVRQDHLINVEKSFSNDFIII